MTDTPNVELLRQIAHFWSEWTDDGAPTHEHGIYTHAAADFLHKFKVEKRTGAELLEQIDITYKAAHPEFVPSDIKKDDVVTNTVTTALVKAGAIGVITSSREAGASLTVQWSTTGIRENIASGHLRRLERRTR